MQDLLKLAASSSKFRKTMLGIIKKAGDSEFNETPPAMNTEQLEGMKEQNASAQQNSNKEPAAAVPTPPQPPVQEEVAPQEEDQGMSPESYGIMAAREFIGQDVINEALAGNPNAMEILSRTAANVAKAMTEMYMNGQQPMEEEVEPEEYSEEGMVDEKSEEDAVADQIVPPEEQGQDTQALNDKPVNSEEQPPKESANSISVDDVKKLLELSKSGKI